MLVHMDKHWSKKCLLRSFARRSFRCRSFISCGSQIWSWQIWSYGGRESYVL